MDVKGYMELDFWSRSKKMIDKAEKFCLEYTKSSNARESVIKAGWSKGAATTIGTYLIRNPHILARLAVLKAEAAERNKVTLDEIIGELKKVAFADIRNLFDGDDGMVKVKDIDDNNAGAIISIEIDELNAGRGDKKIKIGVTKKIRKGDKVRALEVMARLLGFDANQSLNVNLNTSPDLSKLSTEELKALINGTKPDNT